MKKFIPFVVATGLILSVNGFAASKIKSDSDRLSYTIGFGMGHDFHKQSVSVNPDMVENGLKDGLKGKDPRMTDKEMQETMLAFQKKLIEKQKAAFGKIAKDNLAAGEAFLAKNKKADGVKTLPNGLQYKVITAGTGVSPKTTDMVTVNYEGKTIAGKIFDSSYKRGKPVTFPVNQVIPGWTQALQMMKKGATWMVYVPAKLGYGMQGIGPIGPNETLIFKINLVDMKAAPKKAAVTKPAASMVAHAQ
ncbi:MAG: peptidyl-prolyl cis-trans isomerase Mip [marine bacterium B5-7]|nr:MAG: peptidyl-prolyl cis-trans isomerase Mip [marine bacterium B5-7]